MTSKILTIYKKTTPLDKTFLQIFQFCIKDFPVTSISEDFPPSLFVLLKKDVSSNTQIIMGKFGAYTYSDYSKTYLTLKRRSFQYV